MRDKETLKLMDTKCERDAWDQHCWGELGVTYTPNGVLVLVWRCSQCQYVVEEPLSRLETKLRMSEK